MARSRRNNNAPATRMLRVYTQLHEILSCVAAKIPCRYARNFRYLVHSASSFISRARDQRKYNTSAEFNYDAYNARRARIIIKRAYPMSPIFGLIKSFKLPVVIGDVPSNENR